MATVIFDFDSTLIGVESLEKILSVSLAQRPEVMTEIEAVTARGMSGGCSFAESLAQRLALAAPTLAQVRAFGEAAMTHLTPGMGELIRDLIDRGINVVIVSGGLREAILPLATALGVPENRVHAVRLRWSHEGAFSEIDRQDPFSRSKVEGARQIASQWDRPAIVVGDGMTDFELYKAGFADHFVAFCQNVERETVVAVAPACAADCDQLSRELEKWI